MTEPMPAITDREPDAFRDSHTGLIFLNMRKYPTSISGVYDPGPVAFTSLHLASADDLAARDEAVRREVLAEVARARHITVEFDCEGCGETLTSVLDVLGGSSERGRAWPNALGETIKHRCAEATPHADEERP
ncbi:hypothetical protein ACIRON_02920 [Nocardioides sp. NPDC101246]|uniref:hypothetical protein n=1 Tax=Nocardioides sp. NPDC101246 TaxID=3364336 RepID=UPI0037F9A2BD